MNFIPNTEGYYTLKNADEVDGIAILMMLAVAVVVMVGGLNDYRKENQFRSIQEESDHEQKSIVLHHHEETEIQFKDCVVGDLIVLGVFGTI